MNSSNAYDVTRWPNGNPHDDLGAVINDIIRTIHEGQESDEDADVPSELRGKPGAVIYIPPGDFRLRTQVVIDLSFLRIEGAGHGFTSSSIRFNVPEEEWPSLHELWPGGSRVMVDVQGVEGDPSSRAAFLVKRDGSPRISSIEFEGFCLDGLHFTGDGPAGPENSYVNGKIGILVESANDSLSISRMGMIYLEHALTVYNADALTIRDNFIAECGSCVELRGWGQASRVSGNLIGAGPWGYSIYAENHGGLLVTGNNVFPRGRSSITLSGVTRSNVSSNRLHSFYPGMVEIHNGSNDNLFAANHLLHDHEPWAPFDGVDNGLEDDYGMVRIGGSSNTVVSNHFSHVLDPSRVSASDGRPVVIHLVEGTANYIATNHSTGTSTTAEANDSCFEAQVGALLGDSHASSLDLLAVVVEKDASGNIVLDSGTKAELDVDHSANAVRATPSVTPHQ